MADSLSEFLKENDITVDEEAALRTLGVSSIDNLKDLQIEDYNRAGIDTVRARRLMARWTKKESAPTRDNTGPLTELTPETQKNIRIGLGIVVVVFFIAGLAVLIAGITAHPVTQWQFNRDGPVIGGVILGISVAIVVAWMSAYYCCNHRWCCECR